MTKKKTATERAGTDKRTDYVETVHEGAVAANIFVGTTQDGLEYHYYRLSRAFKTARQKDTDEFSYSDRFFPRNAQAIAEVVVAAATRCEELDSEFTSAPLNTPLRDAA